MAYTTRSAAHRLIGRLFLAICGALFVANFAQAGGGPENILVVVNANGPSSMQVANHYLAMRRIPPENVVYIRTPPLWKMVKAADFRERILKPVLAHIETHRLGDQIDQVVYSCDFPWYVDFTETFAKDKLPPPQRPIASLTSATFFYQYVENSDPRLTTLNNNGYFIPAQIPLTPTRAFRGSYHWALDGRRVESGGAKYLLATSLGFIQPDNNTVAEILSYLKRSVDVDGTRPKGTFYYMRNTNVRSVARHDGFAAAVAELGTLGFTARIEEGIEPQGRHDVLGLTTGSPHVRLVRSNVRLLPGALVDNLTSAGGQLFPMTKPNMQTRVSEYLRLGAAGASGTVIEPFAIKEKFPSPQLHVHYARGCSLAESFYQSVSGPFQLLIVGDPLCQPFAHIPKVTVEGVSDGAFVSGDLEIAPAAAMAPGRTVGRFELFIDGVRRDSREPGQHFILDTTTLGDGYHELRMVAVDASPIAIQGRWIGNVIVKNGRDAIELSAVGGPRVAAAEVSLNIASTVDGPVAVFHNGRHLGAVKTGKGLLQLSTDRLGKGPVVLQARTVGKPSLYSRPLRLDIL